MKTVDQMEALAGITGPVVLAAGMFDGVHLGHIALLAEARRRAIALGGEAWVLTFADHPQRTLAPDRAPPLLTTPEQKCALLAQHGMAGCLLLPFTKTLSRIEPEAFISLLQDSIPSLRGLVVGENWRFGHRARGDVQLLRKLGHQLGLEIIVPESVTWQGAVISSTRIREAIAQGNMADARAMLGRRPDYVGEVVHGLKRGRKLGFPTANLDLHGILLPAPGIYAGWAMVEDSGRQPAAVYCPQAGREHPAAIEVHLLDGAPDLYGKTLRLELVCRLREDTMRFDCEADLREQIRQDVQCVRRTLEQETDHAPHR